MMLGRAKRRSVRRTLAQTPNYTMLGMGAMVLYNGGGGGGRGSKGAQNGKGGNRGRGGCHNAAGQQFGGPGQR